MKLAEMTRDERSLILFLETQAVDHGGVVDVAHMNREDFDIAKRWDEAGLLAFGRIASKYISQRPPSGRSNPTHWVHFSPDAYALVHEERSARAERTWVQREWKTAEEYRSM